MKKTNANLEYEMNKQIEWIKRKRFYSGVPNVTESVYMTASENQKNFSLILAGVNLSSNDRQTVSKYNGIDIGKVWFNYSVSCAPMKPFAVHVLQIFVWIIWLWLWNWIEFSTMATIHSALLFLFLGIFLFKYFILSADDKKLNEKFFEFGPHIFATK